MKRLIGGVTLAFLFALCGSWALRGQFFEANKETTRTFDGCNWTTCEKGQFHCSKTLAFCTKGEVIALAQDQPKTICNTNATDHTPNITLLQISCVDYDALKRVNPEFPWPSGKRTQVVVHVRAGDAVRVTVGGETKWADLSPHPDGAMHAMVQFDGMDHTAVDARVFTEQK